MISIFYSLLISLPSYAPTKAFPQLKFEMPIFFVAAPKDDSNFFIVEQTGVIKKFKNSTQTNSSERILDISAKVLHPGSGGSSEEGLLGFAFDPEFSKTKEVFIYYSVANPRRSRISRLKMESSGLISASSEKIILEIPQPYSNHNGGMLAFGPDGLLYIGLGDGGSGGDPQDHSQNKASLLGKILRIDIRNTETYKIPLNNPFVQEKNARGEIYAYGLRNPWRFSFDKKTGDLWAGDVGQNAYEEINIIERGDNLGWKVFEGTHTFAKSAHTRSSAKFKSPIHEYDHSVSGGISVTGGYVYRGSEFKDLRGHYIYGDFGSGHIWALKLRAQKKESNTKIMNIPHLSSMGEDNAGSLYFLSYTEGQIYKIALSR